MADVRVYELAKEFGVESREVMAELEKMGVFVRAASSFVEEPAVSRLRQHFSGNSRGARNGMAYSDRETMPAAQRRPQAERIPGSPASAQGRRPTRTRPTGGFAELLRRLRRKAGMTQEKLAAAAGVNPQTVADFERGVNGTTRKPTAARLADALGLSGHEREQFLATASGRPADTGTGQRPRESPDRVGPGLGLDGAVGVQVGSDNIQLNYFYGAPAWNSASSKPLTPASEAAGPAFRGHAFISYVREDSGKVDVLQPMLETAGIPVWRDTASLWPGEDWRAKIRDAITRDALVFIACFSCHSVARQKSYQNEELLLAIDQLRLRRPDDPWLVPVRFDDCDVPDLELGAGRTLASIQRADLFGANRELAARRLVEAVQRLLH